MMDRLTGQRLQVEPRSLACATVTSPIHSPEHDALRGSIRRFVEVEVTPFVDEWEADGVALFSLDTLRRGRDIDIDGLRRCFAKGFSLALLVEDLSFTERDEFDRFVELVIAMNEVRRRDHSLEWLEMVNQLAPQ